LHSGRLRSRRVANWCLVAALSLAAPAAPASGQARAPLRWDARTGTTVARRWLERQRTPNRVVPDPDESRRGLLISYDLTPKQFPGGFHRSASYDDAVAALAFLVTGDRDQAALTLHALARLVRPDGSLWFAYNTANSWPTEDDHESALVRTGAVAWVGYALTLYVAHAPARRANPTDTRERALFLATAKHLGTYLLSLEVREPSDPRDGLLRLGYGSIALVYDGAARNVVELYDDRPATGISTENNIVAWFFLSRLGALTEDTLFRRAADRIGRALLARAWNERIGQFNEGFGAAGAPDSNKALDCASLGALFLMARGEAEKASRALEAVERYYASRSGDVGGYRPYADRTIYDDSAVSRFFFPGNPQKQWNDLPLVWSEGSWQVALAYVRLGRPERAKEIALRLRALQEKTGGVRYASMELPFEMAAAPSVAGSAWLILVSRALSGDSVATEILR
jgi:hypothetical protein